MFVAICRAATRRTFAIGAALAACGSSLVLAPTEAVAQATHDITITVSRFQALDKADELSRGDFFARATIDGEAQVSPTVSDQAEVSPDWKLSKSVKPGVHKVKLELIDKDVSVDDPIDINRLANKRDLDFSVNTNTGRIEGFAQTYKVGQTITRAGSENKKASISFKVDVKKN